MQTVEYSLELKRHKRGREGRGVWDRQRKTITHRTEEQGPTVTARGTIAVFDILG